MANFDLFDQLANLLSPAPQKRKSGPSTPRLAKQESEHAIALDGRRLDYKVVRRRGRRGVGLKVDGNGLTVAASLTTPLSASEGAIVQLACWIRKTLGEWSQRRVMPQRWETGSTIGFLGEPLILMVDVGHSRVSVERAVAHLFIKVKKGEAAEIEKAVVTWMKKEALPHFAQRAFFFARLHQLTPPQVFLSSANGRWGSCNSRREVRFSWRLIKARPALIDYVVCHELAHLRHMNHSAAFWTEVRRMCPEFETLKKELDRYDHQFRAF
ncbi:MAG: M48 family metallopeptidase [Betaproteobacteria bacterium]